MARPLLIVIGPSASGKSTAVRRLHESGVVHVHPTWTTRPRRDDERAGSLEHRFVTDAIFDELEAANFFLGTVTLPGLPYRYALPHVTLTDHGPIHTVMARAAFLDLFAPHYPEPLVYEIEDSFERARQRLIERRTDAPETEARLAGHYAEVAAGRELASRCFVNDGTLDELVGAISLALRADVPEGSLPGAVRSA